MAVSYKRLRSETDCCFTDDQYLPPRTVSRGPDSPESVVSYSPDSPVSVSSYPESDPPSPFPPLSPSSPPSVQSGSHRPVKKSRYTTIYDEMLRPLDPSVVLPVPTSCTSVTTVVNSSLQQQFNKLLSTGDTVTLEQFLTLHGENVSINQYSKDGLTPLQEICQEGGQHALDKARTLVTHGADIRLTSRDGWSPLHLASFSGNTPLMMFMLKCPK